MVQLPNPNDDYYWRLSLKDGREIDIPPAYVELVKRKMDAREPIHMSSGSILYAQIDTFDKTSRRFTNVALLEESAQAFKEPVVTAEGEIKSRWVKKRVSQSEYDKKYMKHSHYQKLADTEGMVVVGFVIPIHQFDSSYMEYCTSEEEKKLGR